MKYDPGDELVAEIIPQPCHVAGVLTGWRAIGLNFYSDDTLPAEFGNDVYLNPSLLCAEVVEPGPGGSHGSFGSKLSGDKRLQDAAQQVAVSQHCCSINTKYPTQ